MTQVLAYFHGAGDVLDDGFLDEMIAAIRSRRGLANDVTDRLPKPRHERFLEAPGAAPGL